MKNFKFYTAVVCFLFCIPAVAQVQIDKPVQLTGSGTNAKITGIQSVTNTQDAVSVDYVQRDSLKFGVATGNSNAYTVNLSPAVTAQYSQGMVVHFLANFANTGAATLQVNSLPQVAIKKSVNKDLSQCDILLGQAVTVLYDGANFQMISPLSSQSPPNITAGSNGPVCGGGTLNLTASDYPGVSYYWTGPGGFTSTNQNPVISNASEADSGSYYVTATTNGCSSTADSANGTVYSLYVPGSMTFNYTGGAQSFTIPCVISTITITAYGAQGYTLQGNGGNGGEATGTLAVTAGEVLNIFVGGTSTSGSGGFNGGAGGSSGGGGGASDIRVGGTDLSNRVIVAGGGASAGYNPAVSGGNGGGLTGGNGAASGGQGGGGGGTQSAGGAGGSGTYSGSMGSLGQGGAGDGGGGGGGYYGGGGGSSNGSTYSGGGGGSSYIGGVSGGSTTPGVQTGNGQVVISW